MVKMKNIKQPTMLPMGAEGILLFRVWCKFNRTMNRLRWSCFQLPPLKTKWAIFLCGFRDLILWPLQTYCEYTGSRRLKIRAEEKNIWHYIVSWRTRSWTHTKDTQKSMAGNWGVEVGAKLLYLLVASWSWIPINLCGPELHWFHWQLQWTFLNCRCSQKHWENFIINEL